MTRPTARLFVAVDPPAPARAELAAWAREAAASLGAGTGRSARPPRVLEPQGLHLTLCFLGSRPVDEIETIGSALGALAGDVGVLSVGAPLLLPPRRPRALAVEIHDEGGQLAELQLAVTRAISQVSEWRPERRRFTAHITVVRMREGTVADRRSADPDLPLPPTPQLRFTPAALVLYRSRLDPSGASYEAIARRELTPAGG